MRLGSKRNKRSRRMAHAGRMIFVLQLRAEHVAHLSIKYTLVKEDGMA